MKAALTFALILGTSAPALAFNCGGITDAQIKLALTFNDPQLEYVADVCSAQAKQFKAQWKLTKSEAALHQASRAKVAAGVFKIQLIGHALGIK